MKLILLIMIVWLVNRTAKASRECETVTLASREAHRCYQDRVAEGAARNRAAADAASKVVIRETPLAAIDLHDPKVNVKTKAKDPSKPFATLIVRHWLRKGGWVGQLIVYPGKRKRKGESSYYELGVILPGEPDHIFPPGVVEKGLELARAKIDEINSKPAKVEINNPAPVEPIPVSSVETPAALSDQEILVPPKGKNVHRGVVLQHGYLLKETGEDDHVAVFGVRYKSDDDEVCVCWGEALKTELVKAGVKDGDRVEIVRTGRKKIDPDKAPMNLYTVKKLEHV